MSGAEERRMKGRVYVRIDKAEVCDGDVVDYRDRGMRTRRVESAHHGRTQHWVRVEALTLNGCTVEPARRVPLADVVAAWRRRTEVER